MTQESYRTINLFNWSGGIVGRRRNPLRFTEGILAAGENVDVADGALHTRPGTSLMSSGSLPAGEIMALSQVRFPTNESSYLVAQVKYELNWQQGSDAPGPKMGHTAVWDTGHGRMLVFGGSTDATGSNDLWAYDPDEDRWTELTPAGQLPHVRERHSAIYDPAQEAMIIFGGRYRDNFPPYATHYLNDVWLYDCIDNIWSNATPNGTPPSARADHIAVLRTSDHTMIVLQGATDDSDVHVLSLDDWSWTSWTPTFSPYPIGGRFPFRRSAGAYDSVNDQIIIVGGQWADDVNSFSCYSLHLATHTWTQNLDVPHEDPDDPGGMIDNKAVYCSGKVHVCGNYSLTVPGESLRGWSYTVGKNSWDEFVFKGTTKPKDRSGHSACLANTGSLLVYGGIEDDLAAWRTNEVCAASANYGYGLFASEDRLPASTGVFTKIYEFGPTCGACRTAVLNDRAVITEGLSDPPLVWGGCMANDASDWMHPKAVLIAQDGKTFYDISSAVCDKDLDTVAQVGGIRTWGAIYICTDMPEVEGFHFEMQSPNTGASGTTTNTFHAPVQITDAEDVSRQNLKGTIVNWVQDSGTTGHFTNISGTKVTVGPGNDRGDWNSSTAYLVGDTVSYGGARYWCILGNINHLPTETIYWLPNVPDVVPGIVIEVAD